MDPNLAGVIAESAIAAEAARLGFDVHLPAFGSPRADLILGAGGRLLRVQCKTARLRGDVVVLRAQTCRRTADGFKQTTYDESEIDVVAGYCPDLNRCFGVPMSLFGGRVQMHLRLTRARNGQLAGLHFADDYELGAIAQLEERSAGSRKVGGSSPPSSTPTGAREAPVCVEGALVVHAPVVVGAHEFRNRFGWYMERAARGEEIHVTHRGRARVRLAAAHDPLRLAV